MPQECWCRGARPPLIDAAPPGSVLTEARNTRVKSSTSTQASMRAPCAGVPSASVARACSSSPSSDGVTETCSRHRCGSRGANAASGRESRAAIVRRQRAAARARNDRSTLSGVSAVVWYQGVSHAVEAPGMPQRVRALDVGRDDATEERGHHLHPHADRVELVHRGRAKGTREGVGVAERADVVRTCSGDLQVDEGGESLPRLDRVLAEEIVTAEQAQLLAVIGDEDCGAAPPRTRQLL